MPEKINHCSTIHKHAFCSLSLKETFMQLAKYQWTTKSKSHVNLMKFLHSPSTL